MNDELTMACPRTRMRWTSPGMAAAGMMQEVRVEFGSRYAPPRQRVPAEIQTEFSKIHNYIKLQTLKKLVYGIY